MKKNKNPQQPSSVRNPRETPARPAEPIHPVLLAAALAGLWAGPAQAAFTTTGDVSSPSGGADPANWGAGTIGFVGNTSDGTLTVDGGSAGTAMSLRVGRNPGVTGTLTVDGAGSSWTGNLLVGGDLGGGGAGNGGTGIVNLTNGGTISSGTVTFGAYPNATGILNINTGGHFIGGFFLGGGSTGGSTGIATVDGVGSSIMGTNFSTVGSSGYGHLKLINGGSMTNKGGTIGGLPGSIGIVSVDGIGSQWTATTDSTSGIIVGARGEGRLEITNGGSVSTTTGRTGRLAASAGRVIVGGQGSEWSIGTGGLFVGGNNPTTTGVTSNSLITVTDGAALSVQADALLGVSAGAVGALMVAGAGSAMTSTGTLAIGSAGEGRASVTDGGTVTASSLAINNASLLTTDLGSSVAVGGGAGTITNDGTIRIAAGAAASSGSYTPIAAGTWAGTGSVQALGGVYDPANHAVTVSTAATGTAGVATTIDLSATQRLLITDPDTGQAVGASFQATDTPSTTGLTASLMDGSQVSSLQNLLDPGKTVLSAWDFSATGHAPGDPVYLSFGVGAGQRFLDLAIWHFDGKTWDKYLNTDLAYANGFASFVATGLSAYAVSGAAPVPVPAAAWLFASSIAALVGLARRKDGSASA
jgi:fibronectin-binding autotransporter adhesin